MKNFFRKRLDIMHPLDAGRKLNKHETFRRCSRRLLGVLRSIYDLCLVGMPVRIFSIFW